MIFIEAMEIIFGVLLIALTITQIIVPTMKDEPLYPTLRRRHKLCSQLAAIEEERRVKELEGKISAVKSEISQKPKSLEE